MKRIIIIAIMLCMVSLPVNASKEAVTDKYVHEVVEQFRYMQPIEQARSVHDWLILNIKYDHTLADESGFALGLFKNGLATCQGFSFAYYEMMCHLGIPCNIWIGLGGGVLHAWNFIQIDGYWSFVDVTWDNKNDGNVYYDWFMVSQIRDHYIFFSLY